ncbi:conserved hypothetical protein [Leishmania major strain Friedlin]|uniref:PIN domain-containing protein n=1 Tax=Leishmania major TaxID=5664 RepID=Q4QG04_LEIMA|nr:conserved hypothetical protein [Leishmania major strain Friedlin]CAG9571159.1 PIN_domain_containing_protein_-_putative [Leishmania major strain Friedlin]CAJ03156.1 conserved hypothetical protein [Leishmania major strain Friedlin]|eukprot:XP_001681894.1 conserved hypothetical protein [Leishmania major strain Friedlin]
MYKSPATTNQRGRCFPGKPRHKPKPGEQETSASEKESARPALTSSTPSVGTRSSGGGHGESLTAPFSSTPSTSGETGQTHTRRSLSNNSIQSGGGFGYLRATTATPELAPSPASTNTGLGSSADTFSRAPAPTSSPKELHKDTKAWPPEQQPLTKTSPPSFPNPSTPAESSLARLRALAGLTPLRVSSHDPPTLSSSLYRNEESPLRHSCDARSELGSSGPSSASSSRVSSPYTPDLVRRLSFLNCTSAQTTLALLQRDRLKRSRSGARKPSSPPIAPSYHNEEEEKAGQQSKRPPAVQTVNGTANSAGRNPFLTPLLGLADLRASASTLYRNEEDTDGGHRLGTESSSARSTKLLLSRLRVSSPCPTSAAECGSSSHPYIASKDGVAGGGSVVGGAPVPHKLPTGSPWKSAATLVSPRPLAEASPSPGTGVPQAFPISSRLAQLRERASTSPTSLPPTATVGASVASWTGLAQAPLQQPHSLVNLSRLRRLANLQQPHPQLLAQRSGITLSEDRESGPSTPPEVALKAALERTRQHRVLAEATAARDDATPTPPAAIDSDEPYLDPVEAQERAARRHKSENILPSHESGAKQDCNHAAAKVSVRRASPRKGAVSTTAKKESAAAAVVLKGHLGKGTRGNTCHASIVMPSTAAKDKIGTTAVEGAVKCASSPVRAKQLMNKLRSLAAPVPVGETAGEKNPKAVPNPFLGSAVAPPVHSLRECLSQQPSPLAPNKADKAPLKRSVSSLPPSWSTSSPFAALASPSLHAALTQASAALLKERGTAGSTKGADGVSDDEEHPSAPSSPSFASVSPHYSYPSMMTRSATAAAAAAVAAAVKTTPATTAITTTSIAGATRVSSKTNTRTATARSCKSSTDMRCFVFDTSSLLDSEPGVMNLILETSFIGIPFTVLDELDRMHKDRGGSAKGDHVATTSTAGVNSTHDREWRRQRAHELRNWIAACLNKEAQSRLWLQKRTEIVREYDRHATTNDDRILGYAVYLSQHEAAKVLFVTEDKFLRIKASSELGKAYAYSEVRKLVGMPPLPTASSMASQGRSGKKEKTAALERQEGRLEISYGDR